MSRNARWCLKQCLHDLRFIQTLTADGIVRRHTAYAGRLVHRCGIAYRKQIRTTRQADNRHAHARQRGTGTHGMPRRARSGRLQKASLQPPEEVRAQASQRKQSARPSRADVSASRARLHPGCPPRRPAGRSRSLPSPTRQSHPRAACGSSLPSAAPYMNLGFP